ncbi:MAG TPA: FliH/SctL family protein [Candidatus Binatia bacterium]|nr:FliH/SctL family protein [Candidatus Binatia bacterium]
MSDFTPLVEEAPRPAMGFRPYGEPEAPAPEPAPGPAATVAVPEPSAAGEAAPSEEARRAFEAGHALGAAEVRGQVEQVAESLEKALEEIGAFRAALHERYGRELLGIALEVARRIVVAELAERPERWLDMLGAAVRRLVDRERIVVRVPPALAAYLREGLPELRAALEEVKDVAVVEDPALSPGGCVVESRFGEVDLGVETQLATAAETLAGGGE